VPGSIDVAIPSGANITAVAYGPEGALLLANYQNKPVTDPNWQDITIFMTDRVPYRVEYYLPLERDGKQRSFTYQWPGTYAVSNFNVDVRVPQDSTNLKTSPTLPFVKEDAFLNGGSTKNELQEGQTYELKLDYARISDESVVTPSSSQVEPITPVDENTDGRSTLNSLPIILGGFGAVLILIALFFFLRNQSNAQPAKSRKRSHPVQQAGTQTYCHECGARAHEGDRFCRSCGSKFRAS
jgi:hypothetical protein